MNWYTIGYKLGTASKQGIDWDTDLYHVEIFAHGQIDASEKFAALQNDILKHNEHFEIKTVKQLKEVQR